MFFVVSHSRRIQWYDRCRSTTFSTSHLISLRRRANPWLGWVWVEIGWLNCDKSSHVLLWRNVFMSDKKSSIKITRGNKVHFAFRRLRQSTSSTLNFKYLHWFDIREHRRDLKAGQKSMAYPGFHFWGTNLTTLCLSKVPPFNCLQLCQMFTDFQIFLTAEKHMKFATKLIWHYPSHLRHVVTLPWKLKKKQILTFY